MDQSTTTALARYAEIARFVWKYRDAGVIRSDAEITAVFIDSMPEQTQLEGDPDQLAADLEAMGPAFVKIGQSLSTRPDLVSAPYHKALNSMQDECEPVPFDVIRDTIEADLQVRLTKVFSEFDEEPLAAASLGQVHRARLRDGTEVAVKVQRPDIITEVREDLEILDSLAARAEKHSESARRYGFTLWMTEFRRSLMRELDYGTEASNLELLGTLLEQYTALAIPSPYRDLCGRRVLTMDYLAGQKVTQRSGFRKTEEDWTEAAEQLSRAYLDQLFVHGFVHVDPHPGNILLSDDGRLVVLDLGMVTHLSPNNREGMLNLILHAVDGRSHEAALEAIRMSDELEGFDREGALRTMAKMFAEYYGQQDEVSEGLLMLKMTRVAADHGLRPPPEFALLGKTLLNLEHLTDELAPELNLGEVLRDHLDQVMRSRVFDQLKPSAVVSNMLETGRMMKEAPRQLLSVLDKLSNNELTVKVDAVDEHFFAENLQKIANRVSVGLIVAALIVGAAMMMRIETEAKLWGYPAFAMVFFLIAGLLGIGLVLSVLWNDRNRKK